MPPTRPASTLPSEIRDVVREFATLQSRSGELVEKAKTFYENLLRDRINESDAIEVFGGKEAYDAAVVGIARCLRRNALRDTGDSLDAWALLEQLADTAEEAESQFAAAAPLRPSTIPQGGSMGAGPEGVLTDLHREILSAIPTHTDADALAIATAAGDASPKGVERIRQVLPILMAAGLVVRPRRGRYTRAILHEVPRNADAPTE